MKNKILSIIILSLLFGGVVSAQGTELPDPGMTPDSPFYFMERIAEGIGTFFTFGNINKAERYATLAAERLAEAQAVVKKEKPEFAEKALKRYEYQLNKSVIVAEKAMTKTKNAEEATEVIAKVGKTTHIHLDILAEVYEKVSEQAKPAIESAMKASLKGHEKAVEVLKAKNVLGVVPEKVSLPANVPQEIREKIQMRAQEELMVEKVLQISESPRELCVKSGGPSEMCEQIPVDGFESFDDLKTFFIAAGAPAEAWVTVEAKCKELGATKPDECFRVLMFSSTSAYSSTRVKAVPLSEEEIEERRIRAEESEALRIEERTTDMPVEYINREE